jgi:two-component system chemotaxis response regulator CheB
MPAVASAGHPSQGVEPSFPLLAVGGSAGSLPPLTQLVEGLPADLAAAVLICQHTGERSRSQLPQILSRRSMLPVAWADDSEPLIPGRIYVARPGRHLLVGGGSVRLSAGPRVNRHRPSVDVLFASVAQSAGPRATVVVLSGVLDDGAVGSALVDLAGGRVLVQNPTTAEFASMPAAALAAAPNARIMTGEVISWDAVAAVTLEPEDRPARTGSAATEPEVEMPSDPGFLRPGESRLTRLACPECGGGMAQVDLPQISYFCCHVGHQYSPQSLAAAQAEASEEKLWSAVAALEEQVVFQGYLDTLQLPAATEADGSAVRRSSARDLVERAAALRAQVQSWTARTDTGELG